MVSDNVVYIKKNIISIKTKTVLLSYYKPLVYTLLHRYWLKWSFLGG